MTTALRVLLVEDSDDDADLVKLRLAEEGFEADWRWVQTEQEYLAALEPPPDLILADWSLPRFGGLRALQLVRERGLDIPFVIVSGSIGEMASIEAVRGGAYDHVLKDDLARLGPAVRHALEEKRLRDGRMRAEEELRESEKRYRRLIDAVTDYIYAVRVENGRAVEARHGPGCEAVTGYTSEKLTADPYLWFSMVVEEDRPQVEEQARRLVSNEDCAPLEHRIVRKDGEVRWIRNTPVLHRDAEGRLLGYDGLVHDITVRRRVEEELRLSEARFSTVFHSSPQAVELTWLEDSTVLDVNEAWCRLTGIGRPEAVGRTTLELNTWADPHERKRLIERLHECGTVQGFELRLRTRAGALRDVLVSAERIDLAGEACLLTMAVDVTERKRAGGALKLQEERWRLALDGAAMGTWHWEVASGRLIWSDRTCVIFGLAPDSQVTHEQFLGLIHPDDAEGVAAVIQAALSGAAYDVEYRVRWADGSEHWIASHGRTYFDAQGNPERMEGVVRDATQQRRLEEQLRQSQKMEAIGQLAGGVAHDFNNVLGVVLGHCELAARTLREDDPLLKSVREIHAAGERAASLTRQLLAFSRKQELRPQILDLRSTVGNLAGMLRRLIGEHIELITSFPEDLGHVKADPGQVEQVIINLAVNARDAMPEGGRLQIETANVELDAQYTREHLHIAPGRYVLLAVTDTGCGMDTATRERIFEPFFTTKEPGKGTGLGLATVYGIVNQSGGHIWVYSELGQGTTFKIYLPQTDEAGVALLQRSARRAQRGHGEQVLVVEDERGLREIVGEILRDLGYEATVTADGKEALAVVEQGGLRPDILITDVVMPGIGGAVLAASLSRMLPNLKTLFMSGYTEDLRLDRGGFEPGAPFIQKPFSIDDLAEKLSALRALPESLDDRHRARPSDATTQPDAAGGEGSPDVVGRAGRP